MKVVPGILVCSAISNLFFIRETGLEVFFPIITKRKIFYFFYSIGIRESFFYNLF